MSKQPNLTIVSKAEVVELEALTDSENASRKKLEAIVHKSKIQFVNAMEALWELKKAKLYRSTHGSWRSYCTEIFGFSEDWANRMADAHETISIDKRLAETTGESRAPGRGSEKPEKLSIKKARPLRGLKPAQKEKVLKKVRSEGKKGKLPPVKRIKEIVQEEKKPLAKGGLVASAIRKDGEAPPSGLATAHELASASAAKGRLWSGKEIIDAIEAMYEENKERWNRVPITYAPSTIVGRIQALFR